jgi:hypothetical protein
LLTTFIIGSKSKSIAAEAKQQDDPQNRVITESGSVMIAITASKAIAAETQEQ